MLKRKIDSYIHQYYTNSHNALLITGARQIGKTYSIREFGKSYKSFVEINFVEQPMAAEQLRSALEQDENGIIIVMEDTKKAANKLLKNNEFLKECFTIRIDLEPLDNATLVKIAKEYAREQEYSIDDMGVLALHTCIAERQTSEHAVTVAEVKELVDDAIWNANRKTVGHFFDVLLAKRYDDEDMIILREKDFI